jgi:hypothetical protein
MTREGSHSGLSLRGSLAPSHNILSSQERIAGEVKSRSLQELGKDIVKGQRSVAGVDSEALTLKRTLQLASMSPHVIIFAASFAK